MSPEPYVRAQAFVLALALVAESLFGSPLAGIILSAICVVGVLFLRARYRGDLAAARAAAPPHRERLDRIVDGDAQTLLAVGLTAGALMVGFGAQPIDIGVAKVTPLLIAAAAAAVYISSVVDWFIILPRVTGMLGSRPCRSENERHPRFPYTWRETTRWWLVHRIAAALILRFGLAYALTLTVHRYVSMPGGTKIVAGAAFGFLASYLKAVPSAGVQAGHPTMIVGRTVRRYESERVSRCLRAFGRSLQLPLKKRVETGELGPREWVYDVALEGAQVVPAEEKEGKVPRSADGSIQYERDPRKIRLQDIYRCLPAEPPFHGCERRCSGINWYCIENPRCFEPK